ncbi:MAG: hypothetical protein P4L58_00010 [Candidatus Pacebacteria bacterium]|nr:hypothetical protein [Candidatus Paceibacterota bacterium]
MKIFLFCLILFCSLFSFSSAHAATVIYRSVGAGNTANLNANSRTVTISGTTVTFSGAMPNNVGVGDVLQYQISSTYYLAFISSRTSSTQYTVQAADGGAPQAAPSGTAVNVYRAYTSLADAVTGSGLENPAIDGQQQRWRRHNFSTRVMSGDVCIGIVGIEYRLCELIAVGGSGPGPLFVEGRQAAVMGTYVRLKLAKVQQQPPAWC